MKLLIIIIIFSLTFLLILPLKALAVSTIISNYPATINTDSFNLTVNISGATPGTNYIRVDTYKDGTTNYFGETYNGQDWNSSSDGTKYFPITVDDNHTWNGQIQARIGDTIPADYDGTGIYKIRIRRYTAGGNYNNDEAKASAVQVAIVFPTATQTPPNTPTPTKEPTPTKVPTPTPTPKLAPVLSSTNKTSTSQIIQIQHTTAPSPSPTPGEELLKIPSITESASVLSASISATDTPHPTRAIKKILIKSAQHATTSTIQIFAPIGIGLIIIAGAGFYFFKMKNGK